ncbi:MAG: CHAT domain-containing protein [Balneolales bacterium]
MILAAILFFNSVIGLDDGTLEKSFVQADFYIDAIIDNEQAEEYFWALNELSSAHPKVEEYIIESLAEFPEFKDNCYFRPFIKIHNIRSSQEKKIQRLRNAYDCSRNPNLLIALLYELPADEALNYYESIQKEIQVSSHQQEIFNKAIGKPYNVKALFTARPFKLSDIYLFSRLNFGPEEVYLINDLLEEWTNLYKHQNSGRLIHHLMLATIVNGQSHHSSSRTSQDELIIDLLHLFDQDLFIPNSSYKLRLYKRIAFSTYFTGNYHDALQFYRNQLIPLSHLIDDKEEQLRIRVAYGSMQFRIGNMQAASKEYQHVYNDPVGLQSSQHRSVLMNNLAVAYLNNGEFNNYLQFQLDALDESIEADYTSGKLHYLNNLHIYYKKNESWNTALTYLNEAAKIARESEKKEALSRINMSLGTYERTRNQDYDKAISYLESSQALANEVKNYRQLLLTRTELLKTYLEISEIEKALALLDEISNLTEERDDQNNWLDIQARIADVYLDQNMLPEAEKYINNLERESIDSLAFSSRLRSSNVQARYYLLADNPDKALSIAQSYSKEIMDRLQNSADYQSGHLRMGKEFIDNFQILTDLLLHLDRPEEALTLLDEIKNISKFSFYNNPALKSNILNEEELIHDLALSNRMERLRNELRDAHGSERVGINNQITQTITEKNKLKSKILRNVDTDSFDLQKIQKKLKRDEVILYFTLFNQKVYLASISSSNINFTTDHFSNEEIQRVEQAIEGLSNGNTNLVELNWIYEKILSDNLKQKYSKLFVVPDNFLYRLPLEVLPTGNVYSKHSYGSAYYLIEDYSITYVNSLKDFQESGTENKDHETGFLGFGISNFEGFDSNLHHDRPLSSLPHAESEVNRIDKKLTRLPDNKVLTSNQGTEKAFRANAGNSRVMHVASHSEVFHPDPLFSVIYLHGGDNSSDYRNDGLVYAYELFEMDISNEMVMLSSCESGSGNYIQGSGIVGLSRAFTYAGAQSLVMNLWSVRDKTASTMAVSFYDYLNQGYSKDAALRKTKIDYINASNSDPYLWGSYVIYGNDSPLVSRPFSEYWWIAALSFLLISVIWYSGIIRFNGFLASYHSTKS